MDAMTFVTGIIGVVYDVRDMHRWTLE